MIGSCDCCDRQNIPVSHFNATAAYPEGMACFICQGDTDPDPFGELEASKVASQVEGAIKHGERYGFPPMATKLGETAKSLAAEFCISESLPREIAKGRSWKDASEAARQIVEAQNG